MALVPPDVLMPALVGISVIVFARPRDQFWLGLQVGGLGQAWLFTRSLRRGEVPAEARVERWQRYVRVYFSPRRTRVRRLVMTAMTLVLAALVALMVADSVASRVSALEVAVAAAIGLLGGTSMWSTDRRDRRRMARLGTVLGSLPARGVRAAT